MEKMNISVILTETSKLGDCVSLVESTLGVWCELGSYVTLENTRFGDYSYAGSYCTFQNTHIGKFANIATSVRIGATDHPMERPTLHHFTYRSDMYGFGEDDWTFFKTRASRITEVGHDTWIGHGAMIKAGLRIGHGAVIGQGSVVTKDVPDYAIVAGNPARILRYRFDENTQTALLAIAWWDWSHEKLAANMQAFRGDVMAFIALHSPAVLKE